MKTLLTILLTISVFSFGYSQTTRQSNNTLNSNNSVVVPIKGDELVCYEMTNGIYAKYKVEPNLGLRDYNWVVPQGMLIQQGQNTNIIFVSVDYTFVGGSIRVTAKNSSNITINGEMVVGLIPNEPTLKNPVNQVNYDDIVNYSVIDTNSNLSFNWAAPYGSVILSGQGLSEVQIKFSQSFSGGYIEIYAENDCAVGVSSQFWVNPPISITTNRLIDNKLDVYNQKVLSPGDIAFHENLTLANFKDTVKNGDDYYFEVVVQNVSQSDMDSIYLKYYIDGDITNFGQRVIRPLSAGESYTLPVLVLPTTNLSGSQILKIELNSDYILPESNYTNNKLDVPFFVRPIVVSSLDELLNSHTQIYNFPNPVVNDTRFYVNLGVDFSETENITINIYDIRGQLVKTIESFNKSDVGEFTTESWNVGDLSSGIYVYNVVAKNNNGEVKMISPKSNINIIK